MMMDETEPPMDAGAPPEESEPSPYPEIMLPPSVKLEGNSGEAMVNWKRKPDGTVCLTAFEGTPLGKAEEATEDAGPTPYDEIDEMAKA